MLHILLSVQKIVISYDILAVCTHCRPTICNAFFKPVLPVERVLDPDYLSLLPPFGLSCNVGTEKRTLGETWRNPETPLLTRRRKLMYK